MIHQTKVLKDLLRKHGIKHHGKNPSVRTKRTPSGEYGDAEAYTDSLTEKQIDALVADNQWIKVRNFEQYGFAVVTY